VVSVLTTSGDVVDASSRRDVVDDAERVGFVAAVILWLRKKLRRRRRDSGSSGSR
jgi:hypothetical protein